jgi:hypothetical protein
MTNRTLHLVPRRNALLQDHDNAFDVLARVQAPDMTHEQAAKRQPLDEAKRCADFVVDGLMPDDHLARSREGAIMSPQHQARQLRVLAHPAGGRSNM